MLLCIYLELAVVTAPANITPPPYIYIICDAARQWSENDYFYVLRLLGSEE